MNHIPLKNLYLIVLEFTVPLVLSPSVYIHVTRVHRYFECCRTFDTIFLLMRQYDGIREKNTSFAAFSNRSNQLKNKQTHSISEDFETKQFEINKYI